MLQTRMGFNSSPGARAELHSGGVYRGVHVQCIVLETLVS